MAGKITDASALTGANVATGDQLELVDVSDTSLAATGTNKKITADELAIALGTTLGLVGRDKIWDTKGDLAVATGADAASKLAVGTDGQRLQADSSQSSGLAWTEAPRFVVVASDVTHAQSSTTLSDITGLLVPISASATEIWFFELFLKIGSSNAAQNSKFGWTFPTAATITWGIISPGGSTTIPGFGAVASGTTFPTSLIQTDVPAYGASSSNNLMAWAGFIYGGGTAGNVQFQFAQNTSTASNLIAKKGSMLRYTKVVA